jgi:cytoskeletal protein CcmA (bactofilin family)
MKNRKESFFEYKKKITEIFNNKINISFKGEETHNFKTKRDITLEGNKLMLDGIEVELPTDKVVIIIDGNVENVNVSSELYISGDVENAVVDSLDASDIKQSFKATNVKCEDVYGDIQCETIQCQDVKGNIEAKEIQCQDVDGLVSTTTFVTKGDVQGDIQAKGEVQIKGDVNGNVQSKGNSNIGGDIQGNVEVSGNATIKGDVSGDTQAKGNVTCSGDIGGDVRGVKVNVSGDVSGDVSR